MTNIAPSALVTFGIPGLAVLLVGLLALGVSKAERALGASREVALQRAALSVLGASAWAALSLFLAQRGLLARFDVRPPPLLLLLALTLLGAVVLACSRFGERLALGLPFAALVGFQAFRLPLELLLHRAASDGTMPIEMSFSGYNFDILSGASALLVGALLYRGAGARLALWWNLSGLLLLCNIVGIAIAATPMFHAFGPDHLNVWVTQSPFVLLPSILVMAALFGHVLVFRKLRHPADRSLNASGTGSTDRRRLGMASAKGPRALLASRAFEA